MGIKGRIFFSAGKFTRNVEDVLHLGSLVHLSHFAPTTKAPLVAHIISIFMGLMPFLPLPLSFSLSLPLAFLRFSIRVCARYRERWVSDRSIISSWRGHALLSRLCPRDPGEAENFCAFLEIRVRAL